jgi:hypothetical protein
VAHRGAAEVLAAGGLATLDKNRGTLKMAAYLDAARRDRTWQQLEGAAQYGELTGTLFIASTDPETSNSGALYLAAASYVANGGRVAASDADVDRTAPLMRKLVSVQCSQYWLPAALVVTANSREPSADHSMPRGATRSPSRLPSKTNSSGAVESAGSAGWSSRSGVEPVAAAPRARYEPSPLKATELAVAPDGSAG